MARLHRRRIDFGHIKSMSMSKPPSVRRRPGRSEVQQILLHVAAAAAKLSVTFDHEKPVALTSSNVEFQDLSIHLRGTYSSQSADASATIGLEFKR